MKIPRPNLSGDARRILRLAAKFGAALALVCHLLPHDYRAACHALAAVCGVGSH